MLFCKKLNDKNNTTNDVKNNNVGFFIIKLLFLGNQINSNEN